MNNLTVTSGSSEWKMICLLKGNTNPVLQDLYFAIQFLSNGNCKLQVEKTETIDANGRKLSIVSVLKNAPKNSIFLLFYLYLHDYESNENLLILPRKTLEDSFMFVKELNRNFLFFVFEKRPEVLEKLLEFIEG